MIEAVVDLVVIDMEAVEEEVDLVVAEMTVEKMMENAFYAEEKATSFSLFFKYIYLYLYYNFSLTYFLIFRALHGNFLGNFLIFLL